MRTKGAYWAVTERARRPDPQAASPAGKCPTARAVGTNTGAKKQGTNETKDRGRVADLWADSSWDPSLNPEQPAKRRGARRQQVQVTKTKPRERTVTQLDAKLRKVWTQDSRPTWGRRGMRMVPWGQVWGRGGPRGRRRGTQSRGDRVDTDTPSCLAWPSS